MSLENSLEGFIESVELLNEDFMQSVSGTELIDFMMYFIIYPDLVIISRIMLHYVIDTITTQLVHYFDLIKIDDDSSTGPTWDFFHFISLHCHLHFFHFRKERENKVITRFQQGFLQYPTGILYSYVTFLDFVDPHHQATHQHNNQDIEH